MALAALSVFEVRTAGNDANGGGFVTGATGTDWSQQDGKRTGADVTDISTTDGVANGTTTFTSATANFATTIIGNIICLSGGSGSLTKVWRQVTARASATSITLDATVATGTGITLNIGGALASLGMASGAGVVTGNKVWVKGGAYTISSATAGVTGGCFSSSALIFIEGYQTTRGDYGTRPVLTASGISTFTMITMDGNGTSIIANLSFDCAGLTASRAVQSRSMIYRCHGANATHVSGVFSGGSVVTGIAIACTATGCSCTSGAFSNHRQYYHCVAYANTGPGFYCVSDADLAFCLSYGNTGASSDGFFLDGNRFHVMGCVAYNNGRDGFRLKVSRGGLIVNSIAEDNAAWGFNTEAVTSALIFQSCAGYSNASGEIDVAVATNTLNVGFVTGTGSFFTSAAGADFSLNNTAGAGAALRGVGFPDAYPYPSGATPSYSDVGLAQTGAGAPGGGSSESCVPFGGF